jgi:hypothetical protein
MNHGTKFCLKLLLPTIPTSSLPFYPYQKDERALPGYLLTRCSFSTSDIKRLSLSPRCFLFYFYFYSYTILSDPLSLSSASEGCCVIYCVQSSDTACSYLLSTTQSFYGDERCSCHESVRTWLRSSSSTIGRLWRKQNATLRSDYWQRKRRPIFWSNLSDILLQFCAP